MMSAEPLSRYACPFEQGSLRLVEGFLNENTSNKYFYELLAGNHWNNARYKVGGREFVMPRVQTWYADPGILYNFSYKLHNQRDWTPALKHLRQSIETFSGHSFNSVLINYYRDGQDRVDWHSDNERELGAQPMIASLSLGADRNFYYKNKRTAEQGSVLLTKGSLLLMYPEFQHQWLHSIPVDKALTRSRINLTFRKVIMP
ncbi:MAG: alpha-ketoglutarate-dependent dioxygenase AlkB [Gammaproteobacteria bacterium]|nr:alpha-ketoglutarate-dependent dioxygenase AlkB [Gammaproteobacteria bacterium]